MGYWIKRSLFWALGWEYRGFLLLVGAIFFLGVSGSAWSRPLDREPSALKKHVEKASIAQLHTENLSALGADSDQTLREMRGLVDQLNVAYGDLLRFKGKLGSEAYIDILEPEMGTQATRIVNKAIEPVQGDDEKEIFELARRQVVLPGAREFMLASDAECLRAHELLQALLPSSSFPGSYNRARRADSTSWEIHFDASCEGSKLTTDLVLNDAQELGQKRIELVSRI